MEFYRIRALLFVGFPRIYLLDQIKHFGRNPRKLEGITPFNVIFIYHKKNNAKRKLEVA